MCTYKSFGRCADLLERKKAEERNGERITLAIQLIVIFRVALFFFHAKKNDNRK